MTSTIYGSGTLMTRPLGRSRWSSAAMHTSPPPSSFMPPNKTPVLCVSKNPNSYGIHLYQQPFSLPRFQTRNLERPANSGMDCWTGSNLVPGMATTGIFKHPDSSAGTFCSGIAAFYTPSTSILTDDHLSNLGYRSPPSQALCIISSTSRGELYTHTLLECNGYQERRATATEGLPVGCSVVPIPHSECNEIQRGRTYNYGSLKWRLSNKFPIPGQAILKHNVARRSECRSFDTVQLQHLPEYSGTKCPEKSVAINHPRPHYQLEIDSASRSPLKLPLAYVLESQQLIKDKATGQVDDESASDEDVSDNSSESANISTSKTDMSSSNMRHLKEAWGS